MGALDTYNARARRLLTDSNKQYWSDADLNDNINQARCRIAADTKCLRQLVRDVPLPAMQELYPIVESVNFGNPPNIGARVVEVINVTIYWGNMRVRCRNLPWTEQDAKMRIFQNYLSRPGSCAMMGGNMLYLNPVPDHDYNSDWDVAIVPLPLERDTDPEVIPIVWQPCVAYYAAHLSKYGEQSLSESNIFYQKYLLERQAASWHFLGARVRDSYRR